MAFTLELLPGEFVIHRLAPDATLPPELESSSFYTVSRSEQELSILCRAELPIVGARRQPGWRGLRVCGSIDFSVTGLLAGLATALSEASISLFAVSTFDTDYLFVRSREVESACAALQAAGYSFVTTEPA